MNIIIFGKGRIGKAVECYLKKQNLNIKVSFLNNDMDAKKADLIISALPGDIGEKALKLALKYKKDLIDIADVEHSFYFKNKKKIKEKGILVIPNAGFSPGLVNFICGREVKNNKVDTIEILGGSLSTKEFSFPFLWCFDDLIETYQSKPVFLKNGRKITAPHFYNYKNEKIKKIEAETYLDDCLCSLIDTLKVKNIRYRLIRNFGFKYFFKYLENYGFFKDENIDITRKILEAKKQDNFTIGEVRIRAGKNKIVWKMETFSKKDEPLNSMQKITAIFPALLVKEVLKGNINKKGLFFPEHLGQNKDLFQKIISQTKKQISLVRR